MKHKPRKFYSAISNEIYIIYKSKIASDEKKCHDIFLLLFNISYIFSNSYYYTVAYFNYFFGAVLA